MKKTFKLLIVLAMVSSIFTVTAQTRSLNFYIIKSMEIQTVQTNTKDRTDYKWTITNSDTSVSNFIEDEDIIGFKVKDYRGSKIGKSMST